MSVRACPSKAHAPLIVDSNTVLPGAIAFQLLQSIPRWHAQVLELFGSIDKQELTKHRALELCRKAARRLATKEPRGVAIAKAANHQPILTRRVIRRKRVSLADAPQSRRTGNAAGAYGEAALG